MDSSLVKTQMEVINNPNDIMEIGGRHSQPRTISDFIRFSRNILDNSHRAETREKFLRLVLADLMGYVGCDVVEIIVGEMEHLSYGKLHSDSKQPFLFKCNRWSGDNSSDIDLKGFHLDEPFKLFCEGAQDISCFGFTKRGGLWLLDDSECNDSSNSKQSAEPTQGYSSIVIISLIVGERCIGWIQMKSRQAKFFSRKASDIYEGIAYVLGLSASYQSTQSKLRERVKELSCLYSMAKIVNVSDASLQQILDHIAGTLPPALLYPESASACITFKGKKHATKNFNRNTHVLSADIALNGECCGAVAVSYVDSKPERFEGPFLREERNLIEAVAREVSLIVERNETEKKQLEIKDYFIDLGLSKEKVDNLVTVGDPITMYRKFEKLGNCYTAKTFDDRVGVYCMLEAVRKIKSCPADLYVVATTQEEVGLRGAFAASSGIEAEVGIALDVTLANDVPGSDGPSEISKLGDGTSLSILNGASIANPKLFNRMEDLAKEHNISYQKDVLPRGGTDAGAMQKVKGGAAVITLSIPCRYVHSTVETVHKDDVQATTDLLAAYLENPGDMDYVL